MIDACIYIQAEILQGVFAKFGCHIPTLQTSAKNYFPSILLSRWITSFG